MLREINVILLYFPYTASICLQLAAAASNKTTTKKDMRFPEIEEQALQYILDSCELSISKYSKFLQVNILPLGLNVCSLL